MSPSRRSTSTREIDPYDRAVYAKAAENLQRMVKAGRADARRKPVLLRLPADLGGQVQTGLAAVASLAHYATNRVRKHELTTPLKEHDRVARSRRSTPRPAR